MRVLKMNESWMKQDILPKSAMWYPQYPNKFSLGNHTYLHSSQLLCEALKQTLSRLTSRTVTSAPCWISALKHSSDPLQAALWRGVWGKEQKIQKSMNISISFLFKSISSLFTLLEFLVPQFNKYLLWQIFFN